MLRSIHLAGKLRATKLNFKQVRFAVTPLMLAKQCYNQVQRGQTPHKVWIVSYHRGGLSAVALCMIKAYLVCTERNLDQVLSSLLSVLTRMSR